MRIRGVGATAAVFLHSRVGEILHVFVSDVVARGGGPRVSVEPQLSVFLAQTHLLKLVVLDVDEKNGDANIHRDLERASEAIERSIERSGQSTYQSTYQSINSSIDQFINRSTTPLLESTNKPLGQPLHYSVN